MRDIVSWRALQAELVQPGQLPDGLIEAQAAGKPDPDLYILEIATYPEERLHEQLLRDMALVYLTRRVLPEVLTLVLRPKGRMRPRREVRLESPGGWTRWQASWRVVELWKVPVEELLGPRDPGLAPWAPLSSFVGPPEPVVRQCREIIDREAPPDEQENLLAVTQVFTKLRYNDRSLFAILGGREVMIESPLIQELMAEKMQETILLFLRERFGTVSEDLVQALARVDNEEQLRGLVRAAARCPDLESFRRELPA